jgi:hypothetical protein
MNGIVTLISSLRARPRLLRAIFLTLLSLFVLFDFMAPREAMHFVGDRIRGFWALFGLFGCLGMTLFMKWIGHDLLMQPLDFYTKSESGEE